MKILVLNCGSSSIKYKLYNMDNHSVMAQGGIEKIGLPGSFLKMTLPDGTKKIIEEDIPEHTKGVQFIFHILTDPELGALKSLDELGAVGHRMVHGGEKFNKSMLLTPEVLEAFKACNDLAPLHNPANLKGVAAVSELLPSIPQVGVFDTAFHQTMPEHAYMSEGSRIITCHVGNGGSISAVKDGKCIDTSMGLTPLEGLMMGTRSGDVDGGAVTFIMEKEGLAPTGMSNLLNKKSGVLGVTGVSSDMREVIAAAKDGNKRCRLALDMYAYRVKKYIGAYAAAMNGVDVILFTGGVGENQADMREAFCDGLDYLGVSLDKAKNNTVRGEEAIISTPDSKVTVCVIPTDEELMIAKDTMALI